MKHHTRNLTLFLAAATLAALVAGTGLGSAARADDKAMAKSPAPAWVLEDVNGKKVSSDQFDGKVVVIDFWATWCPPCRAEIPGYIELQKKYGDQGLAIVGISLDQQGPGVVKRFMAKHGINYAIVMGDEAVVEAFGGVEGIPTTFIIDREKNIRHRKVGAMETEEFEAILKPILQ
jgi:DsbE subfamily thiol:disulfide oxidoreductase